jgi:hypothetical protein
VKPKEINMKKVTLNLCGTNYTGVIARLQYQDGGAPALRLMDHGQCIATLSVNMPGNLLLGDNHTFIKNWSENEGVLEQLVNAGIVRDTGQRASSGFVQVPMVEIIAPELRE